MAFQRNLRLLRLQKTSPVDPEVRLKEVLSQEFRPNADLSTLYDVRGGQGEGDNT